MSRLGRCIINGVHKAETDICGVHAGSLQIIRVLHMLGDMSQQAPGLDASDRRFSQELSALIPLCLQCGVRYFIPLHLSMIINYHLWTQQLISEFKKSSLTECHTRELWSQGRLCLWLLTL